MDSLRCRKVPVWESNSMKRRSRNIAQSPNRNRILVLESARWPAVNCHQLFERDCVKTPFVVMNGLAPVPQGPGLGIELDEEAIEEYRTEPKPKPYPGAGKRALAGGELSSTVRTRLCEDAVCRDEWTRSGAARS